MTTLPSHPGQLTPPSLEVQHGFRLFLGALGQSLSEAASLQHAVWWSGADRSDLARLIQRLYPCGVEQERHAQVLVYRRWADLRNRANRLLDQRIPRDGTDLNASLNRVNWLLDRFPINDAGFLMTVIRDREHYWTKKSLFHVFVAGRADPIEGYPDHLQAPLPYGMEMWRGL